MEVITERDIHESRSAVVMAHSSGTMWSIIRSCEPMHANTNQHSSAQKRGLGILHSGSLDSVYNKMAQCIIDIRPAVLTGSFLGESTFVEVVMVHKKLHTRLFMSPEQSRVPHTHL